MTTYKMVSSDYPSNTFVSLSCIGNKAAEGFTVHMPLPSQITYQASFDWSADEVPIVAQNIINSAISTYKSSSVGNSNNFVDYINNSLNTLSNEFEKNKVGESISGSLTNMFLKTASLFTTGSTGAAKYLLKYNGMTYNPNKQLFFNGIDHRPLNISFDIVPQNKSQATTCAEAIKKIRVASSPSYDKGKSFFTYPSYFTLKMVVNNNIVLEYNQFAITAINTNLSPNGMMSWHEDGKPVAYTLEITGIETELATADVENSRKFLGV